ncbi:unnamed protein product [Dovyalis caffra]|uniref:D-3-phosphoglycerate dehydrogenase ASB domain-containing protein n=1 Tax=Dovyalis caffra TaxID=77055 RepID=A0AAV1SFY2_9ROSI|nr:unnamed protein product [Dovyalis caffra]
MRWSLWRYELKLFVEIAKKLGRFDFQLVSGGSGVKDVKVTYASARAPDDLDTRVLRAMIIEGLIGPISNVFVNLVNVDFKTGEIKVEGRVKDGIPHLTKVGSVLREENVNVSFMSVGRIAPRKQAIMAIGVDEQPRKETLKKIGDIPVIINSDFVRLKVRVHETILY